MQLKAAHLTHINQARVAIGLQDITLAEANDQVKHLPDDASPDFLMGWHKGEPAPETVEDASNRFEAYRRARAQHTAEVSAQASEEAHARADAKTREAEKAAEEAEQAQKEAAAIEEQAQEAAAQVDAPPPAEEPVEDDNGPKGKKKRK